MRCGFADWQAAGWAKELRNERRSSRGLTGCGKTLSTVRKRVGEGLQSRRMSPKKGLGLHRLRKSSMHDPKTRRGGTSVPPNVTNQRAWASAPEVFAAARSLGRGFLPRHLRGSSSPVTAITESSSQTRAKLGLLAEKSASLPFQKGVPPHPPFVVPGLLGTISWQV
jgi:hypothetical protein